MSQHYTWKIAQPDEFAAIYNLLYNSELKSKWGADDVRRRVIAPLHLGQLITFQNQKGDLSGFLTCAFMDKKSADHQATIGVSAQDWRSGNDFWVVDFVATDGGGRQMLETVMRDLDRNIIKRVRYFRLKHKQLRQVRP